MGKRLYGYVSKENIEYEWKSESGACEVCQGLNGTIYDSANDIPDRPHPNCKCHIEILEKDTDTTDPIEIRREKIKDRKRKELELAKLMGALKSLEQEIDEYIKRLDVQDREVEKFESTIDAAKLEQKDRQKLSEVKEKIDYAKYKGGKAKKDISILKDKIATTETIEEISRLQRELQKIKDYVKEIIENKIIENITKGITNFLAPIAAIALDSPEAYQLYRVGSPGLNNNPEYVQKNGKLYDSINDLKNTNLEREIEARLKSETGKEDCKVLKLHSDSSMAKKIESSDDFKDFLINNPNLLKPNGSLQEAKITFQKNDLYNALHGAVIKDARTDTQGNLTLTVQDLWNFNKGRTSVKGRIGEKLQNEGSLENYYIIIDIKIPKEELEKYKIK